MSLYDKPPWDTPRQQMAKRKTAPESAPENSGADLRGEK